jgi:FkbM family methyltransferase
MIKKIVLNSLREAGYLVQKRSVMSYGIDLATDIARFAAHTKPIEMIFDVGANCGQSVAYYSAGFPQANIYSFEPIDSAFQQLARACAAKPRCKPFKLALGATAGAVEVALQPNSEWNSLAKPLAAGAAKEMVEVTTLDTFLEIEGIDVVDILKIDTEGYEIEVLKGGNSFLYNAHNCFVVAEATFIREDSSHTQFSELFALLYAVGFRFVGLYDQIYSFDKRPLPLLGYCNALFHKE